MMRNITSRPYRHDDFDSCVKIFDGNVPSFFAPKERIDFCHYLKSISDADRPYLVLTCAETVVACGGLFIEKEKRQADLAWGMVNRTLHRRGLGTILTQARLAQARANPDIDELTLSTSQHTHRFYGKFGFTVTKVTADGFGVGLDRWDMSLKVS